MFDTFKVHVSLEHIVVLLKHQKLNELVRRNKALLVSVENILGKSFKTQQSLVQCTHINLNHVLDLSSQKTRLVTISISSFHNLFF